MPAIKMAKYGTDVDFVLCSTPRIMMSRAKTIHLDMEVFVGKHHQQQEQEQEQEHEREQEQEQEEEQ